MHMKLKALKLTHVGHVLRKIGDEFVVDLAPKEYARMERAEKLGLVKILEKEHHKSEEVVTLTEKIIEEKAEKSKKYR